MKISSVAGDAVNAVLGFTYYAPKLLDATGGGPTDDAIRMLASGAVTLVLMAATKLVTKGVEWVAKKIFKSEDKEPPQPPAQVPQPLPDSLTIQK